MRPAADRGSQGGFALLELMLALAIALLAVVWGSHVWLVQADAARVQGHAAWMLTLRGALQSWLARHEQTIATAADAGALAAQGYLSWESPTLQELAANGLVTPGFSQAAPQDGVVIRALRHGVCPSPECRVDVLAYGVTPYRHSSGAAHEGRLAQWLGAMQGWGAAVTPFAPDRVRGPVVDYPNPPWGGVPLPAGTVVGVVTSQQLASHDFLRVRDSRNPMFQGDATVSGQVQVQSDLQVDGYFRVTRQEMAKTACTRPGDMARDAQGALLGCEGTTWRKVSRGGHGGFSLNQLYGCYTRAGMSTENPVTRACSCPSDTTPVQVSDSGPQTFPEGRTLGYLCVG